MAPPLMTAWLVLNILTFSSSVLSIIGMRKAPWMMPLCYCFSICLHSVCTYMNAKSQNPRDIKNFLKLNYSFHIATMSLVFVIMKIKSFSWTLSLGFATFYQLLSFYVGQHQNSTSKIVTKARSLYFKLTNPPLARSILTSLEVIGLMPTYSSTSIFFGMIASFVYLFWFVLYRYALDEIHRAFWSNHYNKIRGFSTRLPNILQTIINRILDNFSAIGAFGIQIYSNGFNRTD